MKSDSPADERDRPNYFCGRCGGSWLSGAVMCRLNQISQKLS
ncbi:hypothetical protein QUB52_16575 [Microcoleus sp. A6-C6]